MAYRRPAVTVIQEFVGLVPALAQFALPCVAVGASFQLVDSDLLGTYSNVQQDYPYASKMAGAVVDLEEESAAELYPAAKKPVSVVIKNALIEIVGSQPDAGVGSGSAFSDAGVGVFADVLAGDKVLITPAIGISVLALQNDGATVNTAGLRDRLTAGTPGQFANVKAGDTVVTSAGANTNLATFTVLVKISDDVLKLSADVNNGVAPSSNVSYTITGDRGVANEGEYRVREKTDDNNLILESTLPEAESLITYSVIREVAEIPLTRVTLPGDGFEPTATYIRLPAGLTYTDETPNTWDILSGDVYGTYRALRNDLAANVKEFARLSDLEAFFGVDQIAPANPLAFGLSIMLQNTTTPVNGLGLDENAIEDETLSFQGSLDVLALTDMYALVPLTQSPVIHQIFKTHVEGLSQPEKRRERVAVCNRKLMGTETLQDESTTSSAVAGSRIIVNTQVDGTGVVGFPSTLNDATLDQFLTVNPGDTVVVVGGTNATPGNYPVASKTSSNILVVTGSIFTGTCNDLQYYIVRRDGIGANGTTFYDRSATFISNNVAPGHYIEISSPAGEAGRHKITAISSEKEVEVEQIPGVVSLVVGITYEANRDLSKTEQANFIKGYSSSLGSRRVVNVWPDTLATPIGQVVEDLPGFYGACAIGAMTTGLPTQQGFTNLTLSGFLGLSHSSGYFSDEQLDTIADGGTMILGQDGPEQALYVRHQLTTDRSAIKFQEFSVTKNVDFIAKFVRDAYKGFPGVYNIVDTTLDELRGTAKAVITFLKDDTRLPRIGGVIRSGTLKLLEESETQIDTVRMRFGFDIPIPLNNLDITIEV